jgi:hypothetical protein
MELVIDRCWINLSDNPWLPIEIFRGGDKQIFVQVFKKCIVIVDNIGDKFPLFEMFGGYESSYIGSKCIKIDLKNNSNIIFKD